MIAKVHDSYRHIVAICDDNLLGKTFEEGKLFLDVKKSFYEGDEKTKEEILQIISDMAKEDATFNIVGEDSTRTAKEAGIINDSMIRHVEGVPYALILG